MMGFTEGLKHIVTGVAESTVSISLRLLTICFDFLGIVCVLLGSTMLSSANSEVLLSQMAVCHFL